jgi:hypothetical protein
MNLKYTLVNKKNTEFNNITIAIKLFKNYDKPCESEIRSCLQVQY